MVLAWGNRRFPRRTGRACASWPKDAGGVRLDRTPRQCDRRARAGISIFSCRSSGRGRDLGAVCPRAFRRSPEDIFRKMNGRTPVAPAPQKAEGTEGRSLPEGPRFAGRTDHAPASIRWLGTRRRAAHLGGRDGRRGKLGEWAGAAGARVEPAPGRACPRATARGHERSGFARTTAALLQGRRCTAPTRKLRGPSYRHLRIGAGFSMPLQKNDPAECGAVSIFHRPVKGRLVRGFRQWL